MLEVIITNILIVQYPMPHNGRRRDISNPCSEPLCTGEWRNDGSVNTQKLFSMQYYNPLIITNYNMEFHIYFMVEGILLILP